MRSRVVLPLPFGPTSPTFMPAVSTKSSPAKSLRLFLPFGLASLAGLAGTSHATPSNSTSRLVFRWLAAKSMPAEEAVVRPSISASCPIIALAVSMRALDLVVRALGPRRSHSISVRTRLRRLSICRFWASR